MLDVGVELVVAPRYQAHAAVRPAAFALVALPVPAVVHDRVADHVRDHKVGLRSRTRERPRLRAAPFMAAQQVRQHQRQPEFPAAPSGYCAGQDLASMSLVSARSCGRTLVWPITGMKFESPPHLGTTC